MNVVNERNKDGTITQRVVLSSFDRELDKRLRRDDNLVMWDVGEKITDGKATGVRAVRFWVVKKERDKRKIPRDQLIPEMIDSYPTDVLEFEELRAPEPLRQKIPLGVDRRKKQRPFPGGVSGGNMEITAGTYAAEFIKDGRPVLFTNAHVGAADPFRDVSKQEVRNIQQGAYDGGSIKENYVGRMIHMVLLEEDYPAFNDACLVELEPGDVMKPSILEVGEIDGFFPGDQIRVGDEVWKSGRTTGLTKGYVTAVGASAKVGYGKRRVLHKYCVVTTDMSDGGDSGSLMLVKRDSKWLIWGYLFAGSSQATVCHTIDNVVDLWGLSLPGGSGPPVDDKTLCFDFALIRKPDAPSEPYRIMNPPGKPVRDSVSGRPLAGARVEIKRGGELVVGCDTDSSGEFELSVSLPGSYVIYCMHESYYGQQYSFTIPPA